MPRNAAIDRRTLLKRLAAGSAAVALPGALAGCGDTVAVEASAIVGPPRRGGTLVVGLYLEPTALDPQREYYWESYRVSRNMYENLVEEDLSSPDEVTRLVPGLATAWTASADATTWTFALRRGVRFHDGTPFDSAAVDFNVRRFSDPSFRYYDKVSAGMLASRFGDLAAAEPVGRYGFRFRFHHPYLGFPRLLAQGIAAPLMFSPRALQRYGNDGLGEHPCGTGPYRFVSREIGDDIVLARNEDYWGRQPYLDRLVFRIIPDDPARLAALEAEEVHIISRVVPSDVSSLLQKGFLVPAGTGAQLDYIQFNWTNRYIQRADVRRAIAQAVDLQGDVADIYDGYAQSLRSFLPPGNVAYDPHADYGHVHDPAGARASLRRAGLASGEASFNIVTWTEDTPEAEYLASNFQAVGIDARVLGLDSVSLAARQAQPQPEDGMSLGEYGGTYPQWVSEGYVEAVTSLGGTPFVDNARIDAAISAARYNPDPARYVPLWREADRALVDEVAVVPTVNFHRYYALHPKVRGFVWPRTNWYSLHDVWLAA